MQPASLIALALVVLWLLFALYEYQKLRHRHDFHRTKNAHCYTDAVPSVPAEGRSQVEAGRGRAAASRLVIAGLAKDIGEPAYATLRDMVNRIAPLFRDYRVVIFENDSTDGTRERLHEWVAEDPEHIVLLNCCQWGSCECRLDEAGSLYDYGFTSNHRMQRMALYRDQYLTYIRDHLNDFDYLLVVDTDLEGHLPTDGLLHSLGEARLWDAMIVNGRSALPGTLGEKTFAYDGLAFVSARAKPKAMFKAPKATTAYSQTLRMNLELTKAAKNLLPVRSAFNGAALYRLSSAIAGSYSCPAEQRLRGLPCEHIVLHRRMAERQRDRIFINPNWRLYCRLQGPDSIGQLMRSGAQL